MSNKPPYFYDYVNTRNAVISPSTVHISNTALAAFFRRYLMQLAMSVYKWRAPEWWDMDYFRAVLYSYGYIAVINTDKFGVIPQQGGLSGYNVFYRPSHIIIANPLIQSRTLRIGAECEVIKFQSDYCGVLDLVNYYANMMALTADTAATNIINSKMSYVFVAEHKQAAETLKKLYDRIASGEPAAFVDKSLFSSDGSPLWQYIAQNVGQNYIADKLFADLAKLENQYKTIIGLPNANTEKKEREVVAEVTSNDIATASRASEWLERLQDGCKRVRDMYDVELSVDWRFEQPADEKGGNDDAGNAQSAGTV